MLAQQVVEELVARSIRQRFCRYIRLNADGEITACLTGRARTKRLARGTCRLASDSEMAPP